jgi:Stage II sporulation protein E (SpoIIE)
LVTRKVIERLGCMPGLLPPPAWATGALVGVLCATCAGFILRRAARRRRSPGARTVRIGHALDPVDPADKVCAAASADVSGAALESVPPVPPLFPPALPPLRAAVRALPTYCGSVRVEARYLTATPGAVMGGDLYEVVDTPFGVRAVIGDVAGHGPDAAAWAAEVLGAFRELAQHESGVAGIAFRIDAFLAGRAEALGESYATAALVQIAPDGAAAELVSCGHPAPLALRGGCVIEPCEPGHSLPLGLQELDQIWQSGSTWVPLHSGDALLFFTDGILEARSPDGVPYPFAERVAAIALSDLALTDPAAFLDLLQADLLDYTAGPPEDDVTLLYLRPDREPARTPDHASVPCHAHVSPAVRLGAPGPNPFPAVG